MDQMDSRILVVLFLLVSIFAHASDQLVDVVTIGSAASADVPGKDPGSVKFVTVIGKKAIYTLKCNEGALGCKTPEVNTEYDLVANKFGVYKCEEVALAFRQSTSYRGFYCLVATKPITSQ